MRKFAINEPQKKEIEKQIGIRHKYSNMIGWFMIIVSVLFAAIMVLCLTKVFEFKDLAVFAYICMGLLAVIIVFSIIIMKKQLPARKEEELAAEGNWIYYGYTEKKQSKDIKIDMEKVDRIRDTEYGLQFLGKGIDVEVYDYFEGFPEYLTENFNEKFK